MTADTGEAVIRSLAAVIEPTFNQPDDSDGQGLTVNTEIGVWPEGGWPDHLAAYPGVGEDEVEFSTGRFVESLALTLLARDRLAWVPEWPQAGEDVTAADIHEMARTGISSALLVTDGDGAPVSSHGGGFYTLSEWFEHLARFKTMSNITRSDYPDG